MADAKLKGIPILETRCQLWIDDRKRIPYLWIPGKQSQYTPRFIIAAQVSQLTYQSRISRAAGQMPIKFLLHAGNGSEQQDIRAQSRERANFPEVTAFA